MKITTFTENFTLTSSHGLNNDSPSRCNGFIIPVTCAHRQNTFLRIHLSIYPPISGTKGNMMCLLNQQENVHVLTIHYYVLNNKLWKLLIVLILFPTNLKPRFLSEIQVQDKSIEILGDFTFVFYAVSCPTRFHVRNPDVTILGTRRNGESDLKWRSYLSEKDLGASCEMELHFNFFLMSKLLLLTFTNSCNK